MIKFEANGKQGKVIVNLPTSVEEITPDYLNYVSDEIELADNYSLIALLHREKLSAFVMAGRNTKAELNTAVIPVFVKRGNINGGFNASINTGDRVLMSPTTMSLGVHVNVPKNTLNLIKVMALIDGDGRAYQNAAKITTPVYFLEFKLIPNSDIIGVYKAKADIDYNNPFEFEIIKEEDQ